MTITQERYLTAIRVLQNIKGKLTDPDSRAIVQERLDYCLKEGAAEKILIPYTLYDSFEPQRQVWDEWQLFTRQVPAFGTNNRRPCQLPPPTKMHVTRVSARSIGNASLNGYTVKLWINDKLAVETPLNTPRDLSLYLDSDCNFRATVEGLADSETTLPPQTFRQVGALKNQPGWISRLLKAMYFDSVCTIDTPHRPNPRIFVDLIGTLETAGQ
jgi:hypothetical protein